MPMLPNKADVFSNIIKKVACPFNVLTAENSQCYCNYNNRIYKNRLGAVALGSIEEDIINHCKGCTFKTEKKDGTNGEKLLKVQEDTCVTCPSSKHNVSVEEDCRTCPFLLKNRLKELMGTNEDTVLTDIPCNYPNIPKEKFEAWLDPKDKKALKAARKVTKPAKKKKTEEAFDIDDEDDEDDISED